MNQLIEQYSWAILVLEALLALLLFIFIIWWTMGGSIKKEREKAKLTQQVNKQPNDYKE